jgi:hypothetical protein
MAEASKPLRRAKRVKKLNPGAAIALMNKNAKFN